MTEGRRSGGRRGKATRSEGLIPQLPWRNVENPYRPLDLASEDQIEAIHKTSMRILSELLSDNHPVRRRQPSWPLAPVGSRA